VDAYARARLIRAFDDFLLFQNLICDVNISVIYKFHNRSMR